MSGEGGAGMAGTTDVPSAGGLPRSDEVNVARMGPYAFDSYTEGVDDPAYDSAVMYYPTDASPPFAAVVFSPGFTATKEQYQDFLGQLLASHGIAMLLTTPTTTGDFPQQRAEDLKAAIKVIERENSREGGPLKGKLAPDRVCVTGHSMGGGGSLWAANELGDMIRCAVPLQPWQPGQSFAAIKAPTMFIAAEGDTVAGVSSNASLFYGSIPDTVPKYYVEFAGASHYLTSNTRGSNYDGQSKYMIAFYKVYLEDDMRYREFLDAAPAAELSRYDKSM
jgi:dienelactone hydrolase